MTGIATLTGDDLVRWTKACQMLEKVVTWANAELGYAGKAHRITFGYIGNIEFGKHFELYSVYLPHPNRVGTDNDRIGQFAYGDIDGANGARVQLAGFVKAAKYFRAAHGMSQHEIVQWQNAQHDFVS